MHILKVLLGVLGVIAVYGNTGQVSTYVQQQLGIAKTAPTPQKLEILNAALVQSEKHIRYIDQLAILDELADFYREHPSRSIQFLLKALAIAEHIHSEELRKEYSEKIFDEHLALGNYEKALEYSLYNYGLYEGELSEASILSLNYIGIAHFVLRNYDKALEIFQECNAKNIHLKSKKVTNAYLINSSKIFTETLNYGEAVRLLNQALNIMDDYPDRELFIYKELAQNYLRMNDPRSALRMAEKGLEAGKALNESLKMDLYKVLSNVYLKKNDLKSYVLYQTKYTSYQQKEDSLRALRFTELMDIDYQSHQKSLEINELSQGLARQRYHNKLLLLGLSGLLLIFALVGYFYLLLKRKRDQIAEKTREIEALNTALEEKVQERTRELVMANEELIKKNHEITEALFMGKSIERERVAAELHDNLGGTLTAIRWRLAALQTENLSPEEQQIYAGIKSMMDTAYGEVRNISHNLSPKELENGIVAALTRLIMSLKENSSLDINIRSSGDFEALDRNVCLEIYSIVLELVTNIIKHSGATKAEIELTETGKTILLQVKDNGIGLLNPQARGKGLKNVEERLKRINGSMNLHSSTLFKTIYYIEVT